MRLFGFIIRIYHDARSPERQIWRIYLLGYDAVVDCYKSVDQATSCPRKDHSSLPPPTDLWSHAPLFRDPVGSFEFVYKKNNFGRSSRVHFMLC